MSEEVFACYSKACAPPPAGKGGSLKGVSPAARGRIDARLKAKKGGKKVDQSFYTSKASGPARAMNEALSRGSKGETLSRKAIRDIWERHTG